ncbi:MAG: hypothetical protein EOP11_02865 [Proteobacteria bacterium]|nr:MAG: hypothetical protein EOP11_02865 [Pseudomonadota bacterium]
MSEDKNLPAARRRKQEASYTVCVEEIRFSEEEPFRVEKALPNLQRWGYTPEYLEKMVNDAFAKDGSEAQDRMGRASARLTDVLHLEPEIFQVADRILTFPGAEFEVTFRAKDKKRGALVQKATFKEPLLSEPARMLLALGGLGMEPLEIVFVLPFPFDPISTVKGLKRSKWKIESQLPQAVVAHHEAAGFSLKLEPTELTLFRFPAESLWADPTDAEAGNLIVTLMHLIAKITATPVPAP